MTELITFKDFCKLLKANPNTVKTWKRRGALPQNIFFKIGGTLYVLKDSFEKWMQDKPNNPAPVIINISDGVPYYDGKDVSECMEETISVAQSIMNLSVADGNVLIFNALIRAAGRNQVFPNSLEECTSEESKFLFKISSVVPDAYKAIAQARELPVKDGSRGCIFEADGVQLISLIDFGSSKGQRDI